MKSIRFVGLCMLACLLCRKAPEPPKDFGLTYTPERSSFKLLATKADSVRIHFYAADLGGPDTANCILQAGDDNTWFGSFEGDLAGAYYAFSVYREGAWSRAVPDPFAVAVGTNGVRAQVVDLDRTDPAGWESDTPPALGSLGESIMNCCTCAMLLSIPVHEHSIREPSRGWRSRPWYCRTLRRSELLMFICCPFLIFTRWTKRA